MVQKLLNLLSEKNHLLQNLTSFDCGDIEGNSTLLFQNGFDNLTSFLCGDIRSNVSLIFQNSFQNLTSFSCKILTDDAKLIFHKIPEKLTSFYCNSILPNQKFTLPDTLTNLTSFTCQNIYDFGSISDHTILTFTNQKKLTSFSCESIRGNVTFSFPCLISFSCNEIRSNGIISFSSVPESLENLFFDKVKNPRTKKMLEDLQAEIKKRNADKTNFSKCTISKQ